ncbi:hypothetical protein [Tateyamaria sp.]|uniref:hypothetical protein n=1 Tax=Tateyamaria sp. TaxID=1929288 RepID=UPI00329CD658
MRRIAFVLTVAVAVAACSNTRPDIPTTNEHFPPLGLASTARWLDEREANTSRTPTAREVPTSQIRDVASGGRPVAPTPVASVPSRAAPNGTIALAAQAFADTCVASLPDMSGVESRLTQVSQRDFGVAPGKIGSDILLTGQRPGNIALTTARNAGRSGVNQCSMSVRREDPRVVSQTLVNTITDAGFALRPVTPEGNAQQAWAIVGAPTGTVLKTGGKRNALGQQVTGVWITWR